MKEKVKFLRELVFKICLLIISLSLPNPSFKMKINKEQILLVKNVISVYNQIASGWKMFFKISNMLVGSSLADFLPAESNIQTVV